MIERPVRFKERSENGKLAPVELEPARGNTRARPIAKPPYVSSTYAPIEQSCPPSCSFFEPAPGAKQRPCYADAGFTKFAVHRLEGMARGMSPEEIAHHEACAIDESFGGRDIPQDGARGGRDLRLHISGDARTPEAARTLAAAGARWRARKGGTVWTYTHAWRDVPRAAWGGITVLASCENPADVLHAASRGYAAALVVPSFARAEAYMYGPAKVIPCVAETHENRTCVECRLCLDRDLLGMGVAIGFAAHGSSAAEVKKRLPILHVSAGFEVCEAL